MIVATIGANASTSCDVKGSQHSELHSKAELWLLLLLLFLFLLQGEHRKEEKEQEEEPHSLALFVLTRGSITFICQYWHRHIALRL
jgi:hypothetical protein